MLIITAGQSEIDSSIRQFVEFIELALGISVGQSMRPCDFPWKAATSQQGFCTGSYFSFPVSLNLYAFVLLYSSVACYIYKHIETCSKQYNRIFQIISLLNRWLQDYTEGTHKICDLEFNKMLFSGLYAPGISTSLMFKLRNEKLPNLHGYYISPRPRKSHAAAGTAESRGRNKVALRLSSDTHNTDSADPKRHM